MYWHQTLVIKPRPVTIPNAAHFLQCRVSSHASVRILQTATYNHNFIVLLLISISEYSYSVYIYIDLLIM